MNVRDVNEALKSVAAKSIFISDNASATSIQLLAGGILKEHLTKIPALLLCVNGEVVFENEKGEKLTLTSGDFYEIEPMVKHWVEGVQDSQLVLVR